jgi:hypothetical protein
MKSRLSPSEVHTLLHAKLDALLVECDLVADTAAYGQTLDDLDDFFLIQGRKFLKDTFELKVQEHIERTEQTADAKQCPDCKKKRKSRTGKKKRS